MSTRNKLSRWDDWLIERFLEILSNVFERKSNQKEPRIKFVGYVELLKILTKSECAACFIIHRSIRHYISLVFLEELTVPEFRMPLRESLGYCRRHSKFVVPLISNIRKMGVAIVYEDLLSIVEGRIEETHSTPVMSRCPLCTIEAEIDAYTIQLIADYCGDSEFQERFQASPGLCLTHLRAILAKLDGSAREFVISMHRKHVADMLHQVEQFIRKHDYRFSKERISDEELDAWKKAIRFVTGS
jgi:hypothetical protein